MRFRGTYGALAGMLMLASLAACSQTGAPDGGNASGACVTDYACPYGQECNGAGCVPISATLYPNIQTSSMLMRPPIDDAEQQWRAAHYDLNIAHLDPDIMRAVNPGGRLFEYDLDRHHVFDSAQNKATQWALDNGHDPEDFYLHYRVDTVARGWESVVLVPGFPPGVVPGWNPGGSNASASERWQSRVPCQNNGPLWYMANVGDPAFRRFMVYQSEELMRGNWWHNVPFPSGPVEGIMYDVALYYPQFGEGQLDRTNEYWGVPINDDHPYAVAIETLFPYLAGQLHSRFGTSKDLMPNYAHVYFLDYPNRSAQNVQVTTPWILGEVWVTYTGTSSPTSGGNRCITYERDYQVGVCSIVEQTRAGGRRVLGARDTASGTAGSDRGKLLTLGMYYLLHNRHTYYQYETMSGHDLATHMSNWSWNPAVEYDVGQPDAVPAGKVDFRGSAHSKEHYEFATGADPYNPSLTYHVLARNFTNALVLVKLLPDGSVTDDRSITVHALDGTYAPLKADGTLGDPVNVAMIRNNEALILIRLN